MKLFSVIRSAFQLDNINITERLNTAEASFTIAYQSLPSTVSIQSFFALVPVRDTLTLTLKNESDDIVRISNHQFEDADFSILVSNLLPEDSIDVKIQIDKSVCDGKFSIYNFPAFTNDLLQRPVLEVLHWFSERLHAVFSADAPPDNAGFIVAQDCGFPLVQNLFRNLIRRIGFLRPGRAKATQNAINIGCPNQTAQVLLAVAGDNAHGVSVIGRNRAASNDCVISVRVVFRIISNVVVRLSAGIIYMDVFPV